MTTKILNNDSWQQYKTSSRRRVIVRKVPPEGRGPEPLAPPTTVVGCLVDVEHPYEICGQEWPQRWETTGNTRSVRYTMDTLKASKECREIKTHQRNKKDTVVITIMTDQAATANICNLRFLGILAGTKLYAGKSMAGQKATMYVLDVCMELRYWLRHAQRRNSEFGKAILERRRR